MAINLTRPTTITPERKRKIVAHFKGDISSVALQRSLRLKKRQYVYFAGYQLLRYLVRSKKIDLEELLK